MTAQSNPSYEWEAITTGDTAAANFSGGRIARACYVGVAGNIAFVDKNGTAVTFVACAAGTVLPIRFIRVNTTNTTADSLVALF